MDGEDVQEVVLEEGTPVMQEPVKQTSPE